MLNFCTQDWKPCREKERHTITCPHWGEYRPQSIQRFKKISKAMETKQLSVYCKPQHTLSVFTTLLSFSHLHSFFSHIQLSHHLTYLMIFLYSFHDSSVALPKHTFHLLLLLLFLISKNKSMRLPGLFVTLPSSGLLWQRGYGKLSAAEGTRGQGGMTR